MKLAMAPQSERYYRKFMNNLVTTEHGGLNVAKMQ